MTCFETLSLNEDASLDEAKLAYRRLVRRWHPDQYGNHPEKQRAAHRKLTEINVAYREVVEILRGTHSKPVTVTAQEKSTEFRKKNDLKKDFTLRRFVSLFKLWRGPANAGKEASVSGGRQPGSQPLKSSNGAGSEFQEILKRAARKQPGSGSVAASGDNSRNRYRKYRFSNTSDRTVVRHRRGQDGRVEEVKPVKRVGKI